MRTLILMLGLPDMSTPQLVVFLAIVGVGLLLFGWISDMLLRDGAFGIILNGVIITGGAIGDGDGRLDFDIPEGGLDKAEIADKLNALVARSAAVTERWITDAELDANPGLVKTMSVQPPRGSGRIRLVAIGDIDLQPCGGTHVRNTAEIGLVAVTDIEKKGKQNRRVRIALA